MSPLKPPPREFVFKKPSSTLLTMQMVRWLLFVTGVKWHIGGERIDRSSKRSIYPTRAVPTAKHIQITLFWSCFWYACSTLARRCLNCLFMKRLEKPIDQYVPPNSTRPLWYSKAQNMNPFMCSAVRSGQKSTSSI